MSGRDGSVYELADNIAWPGASSEHDSVGEERQAHLQVCLQQLEDKQREILRLKYVEGLTLVEAALILNIEEGAAKMRHARALRRLREVVAGIDNTKPAASKAARSRGGSSNTQSSCNSDNTVLPGAVVAEDV